MARRTLEDFDEDERTEYLAEVFRTFPDQVDQKILEILERVDKERAAHGSDE